MSDRELDALIRLVLAVAEADPAGAVISGWPHDQVADPWRRALAGLAAKSAFVGSSTTTDHSCELVVLSPSNAVAVAARPSDRHGHWETVVTHSRSEAIGHGQRLIRSVTRTGAVLSHRAVASDRLVTIS